VDRGGAEQSGWLYEHEARLRAEEDVWGNDAKPKEGKDPYVVCFQAETGFCRDVERKKRKHLTT
jgi:hypothetical protein